MDIQNRKNNAKRNKLCFCCLGDRQLGQFCNRTRVCGIDIGKEVHFQLLHKARSVFHCPSFSHRLHKLKGHTVEPQIALTGIY